jgi:hypothetical protein
MWPFKIHLNSIPDDRKGDRWLHRAAFINARLTTIRWPFHFKQWRIFMIVTCRFYWFSCRSKSPMKLFFLARVRISAQRVHGGPHGHAAHLRKLAEKDTKAKETRKGPSPDSSLDQLLILVIQRWWQPYPTKIMMATTTIRSQHQGRQIDDISMPLYFHWCLSVTRLVCHVFLWICV